MCATGKTKKHGESLACHVVITPANFSEIGAGDLYIRMCRRKSTLVESSNPSLIDLKER